MEPGTFRGTIGRYHNESTSWWPEPVRAPAGAPNVIVAVLDDVGFAQLGCFGSDIETPVFDGLAEQGLRYTNFHTTAMCSPTRATLLTGRNHHANGMGRVADMATGFPGYDARIPRSNGFLSEILVDQGYSAWAVGKWHLAPEYECHSAASRQRWPLGRGFEGFYGFMDGETHQFAPSLVHDNHLVAPPRRIDEGYHLTEDLVDHAIGYVNDLRSVDDAKPFFLYFATGACHAPHQAPPPWIERYRGHFDAGWDVWREHVMARQVASGVIPQGTELSARPGWVPAWVDLSRDQQRLYVRYMEAFAGFLSHTDHHFGRLLQFLREIGELDNTLIFVLSDNGASSEGGPLGSLNDLRMYNGMFPGVALEPVPSERAAPFLTDGIAHIDDIGGPRCHNNYPWGWTVAGNTPFRRWKREVNEGGIMDPLIVHWPLGIEGGGGVRDQYVHSIDVMPTVLDVVGIEAPYELRGVAQRPLDGVSFAHTFPDPTTAGRRRTQYFEMLGCRALYHEGWKAVTYRPLMVTEPDFDEDRWELYHVDQDRSECHDLAEEQPDKLRELVDRWWIEAGRNQVLPVDNRPLSAFVLERPLGVPPRGRYVYRPGVGPHIEAAPVPEAAAVNVKNRSHLITAYVHLPEEPASGVLLALGSYLGGWCFYMDRGSLHYVHNLVAKEWHRIDSDVPVSPGFHELAFQFDKTAEHQGRGTLLVDGHAVGDGTIERFTPARFSLTGAGLTCGFSGGLPVTSSFEPPFRFTGRIDKVVVDLRGEPFVDPEGEARAIIAMQ